MCDTDLHKLRKHGVVFTHSSEGINRIKKVAHKVYVRHSGGRL